MGSIVSGNRLTYDGSTLVETRELKPSLTTNTTSLLPSVIPNRLLVYLIGHAEGKTRTHNPLI